MSSIWNHTKIHIQYLSLIHTPSKITSFKDGPITLLSVGENYLAVGSRVSLHLRLFYVHSRYTIYTYALRYRECYEHTYGRLCLSAPHFRTDGRTGGRGRDVKHQRDPKFSLIEDVEVDEWFFDNVYLKKIVVLVTTTKHPK